MTNVISLNKSVGFTRMDNSLMDGLMAIDLPARELKVALYVAKATINFQVGAVRIKATDVAKATNLHPDVASKAIAHLLKRRVIFREGGARGDIGLCDPKEWVYFECPNQTNTSDSDQSGVVVQIASQTKTDDSLLYSKKEPLVTVPSEQITSPLVSFDGEDFHVDQPLLAKWSAKYSAVNTENEIAKAAEWAAANPRKAKKDWRRFLVNWLGNAEDKAKQGLNEAGIPVDKVIALYHKACPNLPAVAVPSDKVLRGLIVERWSESEAHQNSDFWRTIFDRANRTNQVFYRGENVTPRLEAICSRAIFRSLEERA